MWRWKQKRQLTDALKADNRWIHLVSDFPIDEPIDLTSLSPNSDAPCGGGWDYRFFGPGSVPTSLTRNFDNGSLFVLSEDNNNICCPTFRMFWENVEFLDAEGVSNSHPVIDAESRLDLSEFYNCRWSGTGGDAIHVQRLASVLYVRDCVWSGVGGFAFYAENAVQVNILNGDIDGGRGIRFWGPDTGNTDGPFRLENNLIRNTQDPGIFVDEARQAAIVDNDLDSDIWVIDGTTNCLVEGNDLNDQGTICDNGTANWVRNNVNVASKLCPS